VTTAYERFTDRLTEVTGYTPNGSKDWRCPAHEDHNPSLSVTYKDGRVLAHCFAGCDLDDVLKAIDRSRADLFDGPDERSIDGPKIVDTYSYTDEDGKLLYEEVRFVPKDFRVRRPDGMGGFIWNLKDCRRVLYRLPEVLEAVRNGRTIFVVEGAKDADALVRVGEVATTNALGAGKWRAEYTETLRGATEVVVIADRDQAGYAHARQVAHALRPVVGNLLIAEPKEGKDVADHLAAGYSPDELLAVMDPEEEPAPSQLVPSPGHVIGAAPDGLRLTDVGNAERFINLADGRVRFVRQWGRWIVWQEGRWVVDANDALVIELAKGVARRLMAMVPDLYDPERTSVYNAARRAESSSALTAMVKLARGIPGVLVEHEELDANPDILNCTNGTINLRTGELRRHDPADLCTQQCPVVYDPTAVAPLWEACLKRWQPDPDVREYLQREAGAGSTGRATETVSIHHGLGGNGKSKFFGALQHVLENYAVVPHKSLLVAARHEQHATVVASLFRVRLAVASETSVTDRLNDEQVKNLTGGDRLRARRMREDEWSFNPSHTLAMFSNHRPTIEGTDEGMWRRVRLIPWNVTIPECERDEDLAAKLITEAPGILRWVVEGAVRYLADGFKPPSQVMIATASYRAEQDTVTRFLAEVVTFQPGARVRTEALTAAHEAWCPDAGVPTADLGSHWRRVTAEMKRRGCSSDRSQGKRRWLGVELKRESEDAIAEI